MQGLDISDLNNLNTRLMLNIFSVVAEHECNVLSQRTREALAVLKRKGIKLGRVEFKLQYLMITRIG